MTFEDALFEFICSANRCYQKTKDIENANNISCKEIEILNILSKDDLLGMREIGEKLKITKGAVTQFVSKLVERGVVKKVISSTDKRSFSIALTAKGKRFKDSIECYKKDMLSTYKKCLTLAERKISIDILNKLTNEISK